MNLKTLIAAALLTATALPALADDQGNANAEQQTQPTPAGATPPAVRATAPIIRRTPRPTPPGPHVQAARPR